MLLRAVCFDVSFILQLNFLSNFSLLYENKLLRELFIPKKFSWWYSLVGNTNCYFTSRYKMCFKSACICVCYHFLVHFYAGLMINQIYASCFMVSWTTSCCSSVYWNQTSFWFFPKKSLFSQAYVAHRFILGLFSIKYLHYVGESIQISSAYRSLLDISNYLLPNPLYLWLVWKGECFCQELIALLL